MEKMKKKALLGSLRAQFSEKSLIIIPMAIGVNLIGGAICATLKFPLFMDMTGTILVACLLGPWAGAMVGLLTNLIMTVVLTPVYLPYALVSIACALVTGYMVSSGLFKKVWGIALTWFTCTLTSVVIASIITIFIFGGATGATGTSAITILLMQVTQEVVKAVFASSFIEHLMDRGLAFLVAYLLILKIPRRFLSEYAIKAIFDDEDDEGR